MPDFLTKEDYKKISNYWESRSDKDRIAYPNQLECAEEIDNIFWKKARKN